MKDKIGPKVKDSLYDEVTLKNVKDDAFLGKIYCRIIPRIGETISVASSFYTVKDVVYNVNWERIESVDVFIEYK